MEPLSRQVPLYVFNTRTRERTLFQPISPPRVGLYVCGPTVYGDPHLGHARTAITFDIVFRYLSFLGYSVRYVRNITDVGHLEDEFANDGEDKVAKRAKLEQLEPMEIVQRYTLRYHDGVQRLGCLPPSIEPRASGHIIEQIEVVRRIIDAGYGYEQNGSVYFDLEKYATDPAASYGQLSGKVFDELLAHTRRTTGSDEKRSALDFALWKRAEPGHLMQWPSPWGDGFPGWHLECTTMSTKYLGESFDIHGGGMDLQFPHHEAEIAQNCGAFGVEPAHYWLHGNMLTVDGQKMAKSLGNFITLAQMFEGDHPRLTKPFPPMVLRFFALQTHYRSPLDFSNEALEAAEKGFVRLSTAVNDASEYLGTSSDLSIEVPPASEGDAPEIDRLVRAAWTAMSDDFHTPRAIAALFDLSRAFHRGLDEGVDSAILDRAATTIVLMTRDVLGLVPDAVSASGRELDAAMAILIRLRGEARAARDFATADAIRDELRSSGIELHDRPDGTTEYRTGGSDV